MSSQEEAACGGAMQGSSGAGDDNDKKGKGVADQINPPRSPLPMSDGEADSDDDPTAEEAAADVKGKRKATTNLNSLEAALPIKRSLSGHYDGKSKSFLQLSEMDSGDASDLGKEEHAVNKRRRLLIANQRRVEELERGNNSAVAQPAQVPEHPAANPQEEKDDDDVEAGEGGDVKQQQGDDGI